ncbi:Uncharacterised protein [Mycobacteroides abscessus subsp. abscessus]|nr:Uncharacterised protein [Mycobacteroides abscessus subsp. abscessus]
MISVRVPVTGESCRIATWSPRPSRTCRSTALKQVFSVASGNQRYSGAAESSRARVGACSQSISCAARSQKPSGSSRLSA